MSRVRRPSPRAVIGERQLQRRRDRLRAGVAVEDMFDALGRDVDEAIRKLEGRWMASVIFGR
jgi:hypothetical protein